ncbi:serum amyloid P-component-like [Alligator sinensis]|uniref:Pentraxin family member n=1 Tax=Alligator sinensis TaxID=38654 RepID=A0A3Q0H4A8_ALLSI|nr:serum amyloid P-component-like [Alligator sinensis]
MEMQLLWVLVLAGLSGILAQTDLYQKVFVFRNDPSNAYVRVQTKPEQPLQNFTVCLRSFSDQTRPYGLFSYASKAHDNEILIFKLKSGEYRLYVGGEFVMYHVPENRMDWDHVCASWESAMGLATFWINGKPLPRKGLQKGYFISTEAMILLGQKQDGYGGSFDPYNSLTGEMADVYMWEYVLSPAQMRAAYLSLRLPPCALGWRNLQYEIKGDVVVKPRLRESVVL